MAQITLTIPSDKVDEFMSGFLYAQPIPRVKNPKDPNDRAPAYTSAEWVRIWLMRQAFQTYRDGKRRMAEHSTVIDEEIIE